MEDRHHWFGLAWTTYAVPTIFRLTGHLIAIPAWGTARRYIHEACSRASTPCHLFSLDRAEDSTLATETTVGSCVHLCPNPSLLATRHSIWSLPFCIGDDPASGLEDLTDSHIGRSEHGLWLPDCSTPYQLWGLEQVPQAVWVPNFLTINRGDAITVPAP